MFGNSHMNYNTGNSMNSLSARKQMFNSTSSSFAKTPNKSSFSIRRSSSTSFKNTQGKLDTLKQDLTYLDSDVQNLRGVTKESRLYVKFMKEDLLERKMPEIETDLSNQIKNLKKAVGINKRSDQLRYEGVLQTVEQLRKNSRNIMNELHSLTDRMNRIQNTMGFYSAAQKHK